MKGIFVMHRISKFVRRLPEGMVQDLFKLAAITLVILLMSIIAPGVEAQILVWRLGQ